MGREQVAQIVEQGGRSLALGHVEVGQRGDPGGEIDVGGEQQDRNFGLDLAHLPGDLTTMHAGHGVVQDDGIDGMGGEEFQAGGAVGGDEHPVSGAFQKDLPDAETDGFVVHAEDQMRSVLHKCNTLLGLARSVASIPLGEGRHGCGVEGCEGFIVCLQKEACAWAMLSWAAPEGLGGGRQGQAFEAVRARGCTLSQTVFVLEDDADILRLVQFHLEAAGYTVRTYTAMGQIVADAERQPPALFLLDIMVPGGDGLDLCRRLRKNTALSTVPIIFLTARAAESDRVMGLELGADDYITKPFGTRELVARVKAVLRRFERPTAPSVVKFDAVEIDANAMQLRVSGELVTTTATEFRLLDYLARHPGRVFSRDQLLDAVWGDARFVTPRSVDVYVRRIREKIEEDAEAPRYLKTMRGAGYRFEIPKAAQA